MAIGSKIRRLAVGHRSQQDYGAIQEFRGHLYQIFWSKGLSVGDSKARSIGIVDILIMAIGSKLRRLTFGHRSQQEHGTYL